MFAHNRVPVPILPHNFNYDHKEFENRAKYDNDAMPSNPSTHYAATAKARWTTHKDINIQQQALARQEKKKINRTRRHVSIERAYLLKFFLFWIKVCSKNNGTA